MRLHLFAGALALGIGAASLGRAPGLVAICLGGALACAGVTTRASSRLRLVLLALACGLIGWGWGSARLDALDRSVLRPLAGRSGRLVAVVTAPPRPSPFAVRAFARAERFDDLVLSESVLLELPRGRGPPQGARLELFAEVELPRKSRSGFDERKWLRRRGVHVVLDGGRWRIVGRRGGLGGLADRLRQRLIETTTPRLTGERRAILRGVVLGEDEGLDEELRDAFRASGLYHLLAVSGQNVALLVGGVLGLAWVLGVPRLVGHAVALAAICAYVLAVGWQPSVVRAGVAGGLASLAWLTARQRDRWWFLLVGALVLLAWNPSSALEPGFQLSFAAVAAIFVVVPRLERRLEGYPLPLPIRAAIAVSLACGVATVPILWLHFEAIPLYSVPANVLAAPVVAPLLGLALGAAALEPLAPGAAAVLAWANGWCAAYLAASARAIASLPAAQLTTNRALALSGAVVLAAVILPRLHPPRLARASIVGVTAVVAVVGWRPPGAHPPPPPDALRITFLEVGQGDATLLEVPEGSMLVDQGPPEARVHDQLTQLGVRQLVLMLLTHPSRDNIGGAREVVERLRVRLLMDPQLPFENPFGAPAIAEARRKGIRIVTTRAGQEVRLGRLRVRILWPPNGSAWSSDTNDHATVLLASYGDFDALLPADAESNVLTRLGLGRIELYKVAHHGSADAGLPELLERLRPQLAVISVGAENEYGHPAPSTLAALRARHGLRLLRTDHDGRIVVESNGQTTWVRSER